MAIVSIDKDFFQLVRPGVRVYDPREDGAWFDEAGVVEKFGVKPSQVVDVLALVGDTSDNVAGVPGIGKKGAIDLVTPVRRPRRAARARGGTEAEAARGVDDAIARPRCSSRELVTIRADVPLEVDFESLRYRGPTPRALLRAVLATRVPHASSPSTRRRPTRSRRTTRSSRRSRSSMR